MKQVKVWLSFPEHLSKEVVDDRISLLDAGALSLRDAQVTFQAWDSREHEA